jgi:electron transfer flavoprotein beta subunit
MKIIVCIKQVPDSTAKVVVENGKVSWGDAPLVMNPWDEYAVEAALQQKEALGGTVTAITIGDDSTRETLKKAVAMGADDAILINDPALVNMDTQATAQVLAAAINKIGAVDMAFFGRQAIDGDAGLVPAQAARILGWPALTLASVIKVEGGAVRVERGIEEGRQVVTSRLPAVFSLTKDFGEPRYPSFMGIRKAAKAEIPTWTLSDIGIQAPASVISWLELMNPPSREVKCEFITGASPQEIAEALADKIIAEKLL